MRISWHAGTVAALFWIAPALIAGGLPPTAELAPIDRALTLVQFRDGAQLNTLLVTGVEDSRLSGIDLTRWAGSAEETPLGLVERFGHDRLAALATSAEHRRSVPTENLSVPEVLGGAHIGAGTNYSEHGEEAGIDEVFLFPKFSRPSRSGSIVSVSGYALLDYEVELCVRFGRPISSMGDFSAAAKGFFLCADMTDRAALLRNIDLSDVSSGVGFSDGKSGDDRFPVGYLTVVPRDWRAFLEDVELNLRVNGELRQQAVASEMIKNVEQLVMDVLLEGGQPHWRWRGRPVPLLESGAIEPGQAILTGTPGGVIFRQPGIGFIAGKAVRWLLTLAFLDQRAGEYLVEQIIAKERDSDAYLRPGDTVEMRATYLGTLRVEIGGAGTD